MMCEGCAGAVKNVLAKTAGAIRCILRTTCSYVPFTVAICPTDQLDRYSSWLCLRSGHSEALLTVLASAVPSAGAVV